ncbi:MAG: hypothetical protein IJR90_06755 [Clostridia bacterium]|nr:hypothetical protein [Clostridia bacterium]
MDQSYWVLEYVKVLFAYAFVMYIWPSVVFRPHLAGRSRTYRFCFCVNISILVINTGVLLLGLVRILNVIIVGILYFGVFLIQLYRNYHLNFRWVNDIKAVNKGTMSARRMLFKWRRSAGSALRRAAGGWWGSTKGRRIDYLVLLVLVGFAMMYFSRNALQVHSYGFGDQYVHHSWIYGLKQGKIFSAGIYPEAMHCVIYLTCSLFRINVYSGVLFFAGIHIQVYIVSAYIFMRAVFRWRMTPLFVIAGFLTLDQYCINGVFGISRLSWTLPQEFALYTVFLSGYALIRFLRKPPSPDKGRFRFFKLASWKRYLSDGDLFIFIITVASSLTIHFYATIIAAFVCIVVVLLNINRLFVKGKFIKLVGAVGLMLAISVTPMAAAYAEGYPLQGSLTWALSVTAGESVGDVSSDLDDDKATADTAEEETAAETEKAEAAEGAEKSEAPAKTSLKEKLLGKFNELYRGTYIEMFGHQRGQLLFRTTCAVGAASVLLLCVTALIKLFQRKRPKEKRTSGKVFNGWLCVAVCSFVMFVAYNPRTVGLPPLVAGTRVCSTLEMFGIMVYGCILDAVFSMMMIVITEKLLKPLSVLVCAGIYAFTQFTGIFHGYLYYELTRYPQTVELTKNIVNNMPEGKYTVISTTDEMYQVIESGYHEEWIDLLEKWKNRTYTIPTPYLFFFIEKRPIHYAHSNFASGPKWLAWEKYSALYGSVGAQYPEYVQGTISDEFADMPLNYGKKRSETASSMTNRQILESKAYRWYQKFSKLHPNDGRVVYEDENILCYCVYQNEFSLFTIGIMGD